MLDLSHLKPPSPPSQPLQLQPQRMSPEQRAAALNLLAKREHARFHLLSQVESIEPNWLTDWIHEELGSILDTFIVAVERKLDPRLIISLPPRAGKTSLVGRHLPVHVLGRHPDWEFVYATFNDDRATDVGRKVRDLMADPIIQSIHPNLKVDPRANSATNIGLEAGGTYYAVGRGGALTGRGFHIGVVDDILKDREEAESEAIKTGMWDWFTSVFSTRPYPGAGMILMSTRWAMDDLTGRVTMRAKADAGSDQYMEYSFPAIALTDEPRRKRGDSYHPKRFSTEWLEKQRKNLGARDFESMYQQNPFVPEGNHFKADWFQLIKPEQYPSNLRHYITTDFAASQGTGDYSVAWDFGISDNDDIYFSPDPFYEQCEIATHDESLWDLAEKHEIAGIFVEKGVLWKAHGGGFRQQSIGRRFYPKIIEIHRTKAKLEAAGGLMTHMQRRKVFFPDTPFVRNVVIPQFLRFTGEKGGKDDLVDGCTLPFLAFKELQRPVPLEFEEAEVKTDPTTRWILDRMGNDKPKIANPFGAGDRDGTGTESDDDDSDEPFKGWVPE